MLNVIYVFFKLQFEINLDFLPKMIGFIFTIKNGQEK